MGRQCVNIIKTVNGSPDGLTVKWYMAGQTMMVEENELAYLIDQGAVELVENKAIQKAERVKRRGKQKVT